MITLLSGENSFELTRALDAIIASFEGDVEKFDSSELNLSQLPDLLLGGTLFSSSRLIVIRELSANKQLWDVLPDWLEKVDAETHIVLIEPKPDKRTKTFKELKKNATVREFLPWGDRDLMLAEKWSSDEAKRQGFELDRKSAQILVTRVGLDQWQLFHAIEKLAVLDSVNSEIIEELIEANPAENVFNLFDSALRGDTRKVSTMIGVLERSQDPYMTFGLLSSQAFQLAALAVSSASEVNVAKAIGAHPYALSKLSPHARKLGRGGAKKIIQIFADTDAAIKSSATDPWLLIEDLLVKVALV